MTQELRYDGRVVVVTGAGNGLGRAHALEFARRGAKVVVNDLGGSHTGQGKSSAAADAVVAEIVAAGGEAVANYDSVEDGQAIVRSALDAFGRIDVLVNNAGILRDVSFAKMTEADWDLVQRVHVKGAFACTHAAWPHMREQKYGRVIFTASAAGIYGNFGQANYALAKLGLVGLSNTLALEGQKAGIRVNTIAPVAGSRMTETILPPNLLEALRPEYVTALVAALAHESSEETGGLFEVGGGFYAKLRWERAEGETFRLGRVVRAEDVAKALPKISSFEKSTHPPHIHASLEPIMANVEAGPSKGGNQYIDVDRALGYEFPERTSQYDERDLAIYALGVGAATDPTDDKDLQLVYELHAQGFKALPTFGVIPAINLILTMGKEGITAPGLSYGLDRVLHGEQYLELTRPLPPRQTLRHKARVAQIYDKGQDGGKKGGAVVVNAIDSFGEDGELLLKNEVTTFIRGAGGWGGDRGPSNEVNVPPERTPDVVSTQTIDANQALLYRLSGDWNPLHADPGFAKAFGFERPILHGLCTFGYAARHVIRAFAKDGDPRYFKSVKVRFAQPVLPGETVVTEMWKESETRVVFRVKVAERDAVVISNAAIEFFEEIPSAKPAVKPAAKSEASSAAKADAKADAKPAGEAMPTSADVFAGIESFVEKSGAEAVAQAKTIFTFKLSAPSSVYTLDLKNGAGAVHVGAPIPGECVLEITDADFMDMVSGKADAMKLFTTGKLKISGNVMASQKLGGVLSKVRPEDVMAAMQRRLGGATGGASAGGASDGAASAKAAAPEAAPAPARQAEAPAIVAAIGERFTKEPGLLAELGAVIELRVTDPDATYVLDLEKTGAVTTGGGGGAAAILTLADADLARLWRGEVSAQSLYQRGLLRLDGDARIAPKLALLGPAK